MATDYRVEFTITRRRDGEDDFTEIGFGSSCAWPSVDAAAYEAGATLQRGEWETKPGMPDPRDVIRDGKDGSDA